MRVDKDRALKLRLSGKSYREINIKLGIPKSTLSAWLSAVQLSEKTRNSINANGRQKAIEVLVARNKQQTALAIQRGRETKLIAQKDIAPLTDESLRLVGATLYWAEGYKRPKTVNGRAVSYHPVSFTNSDPLMVNLFLQFLRKTCAVPETRIKVSVRYFPHQNVAELVDFWQKSTNLPRENFGKPLLSISLASRSIRPFNQLPYGVVQIRVSDTTLFYRIMGWIEGLKQFS
ncbi:MAG TPA: hypothetical protein VLE93_00905 [Candidatus Saccharimonadales bacterium]|nr:hypothetical protein [Candidatus Saccharimonadales bacterium]